MTKSGIRQICLPYSKILSNSDACKVFKQHQSPDIELCCWIPESFLESFGNYNVCAILLPLYAKSKYIVQILPIVHHSLPAGVQCHKYSTNFCLPSHSSVHSTSSLAEPHRHFLSHDHHNRSHDLHRLVPHNKFDSKKLVVHLKIKL